MRWWTCWLLAAGIVAVSVHDAWTFMNDGRRGDGNGGHCTIDFGNQYLMGRMMLKGHGTKLYDRRVQRDVLREAWPEADGIPGESKDWQDLYDWMVESEEPAFEHIGGPLYPPVHAMLYSPLGLLTPRYAYRVLQLILLLLAFYSAWVVHHLSSGRLWWPVVIFVLILWPGWDGAICLAQNPSITLALLLTGWWQLQKGRPFCGGIAWGFLMFKPVWLPAFGLVMLLRRQWRFLAGMILTAEILVALTIPLVGWDTWLNWLEVGRLASKEYSWQENWIILSRDLSGWYRHGLLTFQDGYAQHPQHANLPHPNQDVATGLSWALWAAVVGGTAAVACWRRRQVAGLLGPGAALLLLGGYFATYHFMYYDILVGAFPLAVLFAEPARFLQLCLRPRCRAPLSAEQLAYYQPTWECPSPPPAPLAEKGNPNYWVCNPLPPLLLVLLLLSQPICIWLDPTYHFPPADSFMLLAMWFWCLIWVARGREDLPGALPPLVIVLVILPLALTVLSPSAAISAWAVLI